MSGTVAESYPTRSTLHHKCAGAPDLAARNALLLLETAVG